MGRDVTCLRIGRALDSVHGTVKIINERVQPKQQVAKDLGEKRMTNEVSQENQNVLTVRSINTNVCTPEGEITAGAFTPTEKTLNSPGKTFTETNGAQSVQTSSTTAALDPSKTNELLTSMTESTLQKQSPWTSRKGQKTHHDEEDAYCLASSAAISVQSSKAKVTVPVAPTFRAAERAERRKEFQKKFEEKQKALEAERLEFVARTKEEEEKVIKQLRKSMAYKANHVPSFYREGPPPKVELKKLPVTRPKSPNLTRRKSYSDVVKPSSDEKKCCAQTTRHSIGVCNDVSASPATPKSKDLSGTRNANGPSKFKYSNGSNKVKATRPKGVKDTTVTPHTELDQKCTDICVVSETKTTQNPERVSVRAIVVVNTRNSGTDHTESATEAIELIR